MLSATVWQWMAAIPSAKRRLRTAALRLMLTAGALWVPAVCVAGEAVTHIQLVFGAHTLQATLDDTPAAQAFAAQLPLELILKDYHRTEKIADLPQGLPVAQAPKGVDPEVGDITFFAPWGKLALFYKDFGYSRGLVRLGRMQGDLSILESKGDLLVRIEQVKTTQGLKDSAN